MKDNFRLMQSQSQNMNNSNETLEGHMPKFLCSTNTLRHQQRPPAVPLRTVAGDTPEQETCI